MKRTPMLPWFSCLAVVAVLAVSPGAAAQEEPPAVPAAGPSAPAAELGLDVGVRIGGNFSQLSAPTDPEGYPTVLFGTAFTGLGFTGGVAVSKSVPLGGALGAVGELDLLLSYHTGQGFAEQRNGDARRELTLSTMMLRVPLLIGVEAAESSAAFRFALGPELLAGLSASGKPRQTNLPGEPDPFPTTTATHIGLTTALSFAYDTGDFAIPVEFRFTYDPFVPNVTRERFAGYSTIDEPGEYRVAFDLQFFLMTGITFSL